MKNTIILRSNEVSAINDVLGTYGSEKRVIEITKKCGYWMVLNGSFDPKGNYRIEVKIRTAITLGVCKIAMDHAPAIKGLIQAINGIKDTINYIGRNISRDIKNLFKEYE